MDYLISNKLVENSSSSLAKFLRTTHGLDKTIIGDYLDQHEEFLLGVMQSYIDFMKCFGMKFGSAIHEFLKGFRLPGEAQKIDRIMKKVDEAARGGAVVEGGHGGEGGRSRLGTEGDAEPVQDPYREKS